MDPTEEPLSFGEIARSRLTSLQGPASEDDGKHNEQANREPKPAGSEQTQDQNVEPVASHEAIVGAGVELNMVHIDEALAKGIELIVEMVDGNREEKLKFSQEIIDRHFGGKDPTVYHDPDEANNPLLQHGGFDLIQAISSHPVLVIFLGRFLRPNDLLNLYCTSRDFHTAVQNYLLSSIVGWLKFVAPTGARDFPFRAYAKHTTLDPAGRTYAFQAAQPDPADPLHSKVRVIPSLKWYLMVAKRERYVRDILAYMARCGHRTPASMGTTLKRIWFTLDVSTTAGRSAIARNERFWTDTDLYNAQMFIIKLTMLFNNPISSSIMSDGLTKLMINQKGLFALWQLLFRKRFRTRKEIVELKVRYSMSSIWRQARTSRFSGLHVYGVPIREVGRGRREGWGLGKKLLIPIENLVMVEAVSRGLELEKHLRNMMLWGSFDWSTGKNLIPSEEELYFSDEDEVMAQIDTGSMFKMRHPKKQRWHELTEKQKEDIRMEERLEEMYAVKVARCIPPIDAEGKQTTHEAVGGYPVVRMTNPENYDYKWEFRRGWTTKHFDKRTRKEALAELPKYERQPTVDEQRALELEIKDNLKRADDMVSEDFKLQVQAMRQYTDEELDFDYDAYLAEHGEVAGLVGGNGDDDADAEDGGMDSVQDDVDEDEEWSSDLEDDEGLDDESHEE